MSIYSKNNLEAADYDRPRKVEESSMAKEPALYGKKSQASSW